MTTRTKQFLFLIVGLLIGFSFHLAFEAPSIWQYQTGESIGFPTIPVVKINKITRRVYLRDPRGNWTRLYPNPPLPGDPDFIPSSPDRSKNFVNPE